MAKLIFRYGAMGSSKTANGLQRLMIFVHKMKDISGELVDHIK